MYYLLIVYLIDEDADVKWDTNTVTKAQGLHTCISSYGSLITIVFMKKTLLIFKRATIALQERSTEISENHQKVFLNFNICNVLKIVDCCYFTSVGRYSR